MFINLDMEMNPFLCLIEDFLLLLWLRLLELTGGMLNFSNDTGHQLLSLYEFRYSLKVCGLETHDCFIKWIHGIITIEKETRYFVPISAKCELPSPSSVGAALASGRNTEKNSFQEGSICCSPYRDFSWPQRPETNTLVADSLKSQSPNFNWPVFITSSF